MSREELWSFVRKNVWLFLLLAAGVILLLPGGRARDAPDEAAFTNEELRLEHALAHMQAVGEVCVLLAEKPGREPGYQGAVVVCAGADSPEVRLRIVETVAAFTGLGSHQIVVQAMR